MKFGVAALLASMLFAFAASALAQEQSSYPVLDKLAAKVVSHYESASCGQIAAEKQTPPSAQKANAVNKAVQYMHENPQAAQYFIGKVATPIANKMFACGMIP